jgi:hypothetical protein
MGLNTNCSGLCHGLMIESTITHGSITCCVTHDTSSCHTQQSGSILRYRLSDVCASSFKSSGMASALMFVSFRRNCHLQVSSMQMKPFTLQRCINRRAVCTSHHHVCSCTPTSTEENERRSTFLRLANFQAPPQSCLGRTDRPNMDLCTREKTPKRAHSPTDPGNEPKYASPTSSEAWTALSLAPSWLTPVKPLDIIVVRVLVVFDHLRSHTATCPACTFCRLPCTDVGMSFPSIHHSLTISDPIGGRKHTQSKAACELTELPRPHCSLATVNPVGDTHS